MTGDDHPPIEPNESPFTQLVAPLLGALAAGLGSIGFVVAVGAIVTQARYRGAGLPSEQGVSVVPRSVLLAVGGEVLAIAVLVALALVAAVHWSRQLNLHGRRAGSGWWWGSRWRVFFALLVFALAIDYYFFWAGSEVDSWTQFWILLGVIAVDIVGAGAAAAFAAHAVKHRDREPPDPRGEGFRLIGLLLTVALLGGIAAAAGSLTNPRVRPAAVLLEGPSEMICGLYVGQTSDHVYIGEAVPKKDNIDLGDHSKGSIIEVDRHRVRRLVIGSSQSLTRALNQAEAFVPQLEAAMAVPETGCKR